MISDTHRYQIEVGYKPIRVHSFLKVRRAAKPADYLISEGLHQLLMRAITTETIT